nr:hypothetical protein C34F11.7 - Caenorhabditis elegans [Caenorhabditis elegans]
MDDDWATSGVLEKDVFISSVHDEKDTLDILKLFDNDIDGFSDDNFRIKMEPNDETSGKTSFFKYALSKHSKNFLLIYGHILKSYLSTNFEILLITQCF